MASTFAQFHKDDTARSLSHMPQIHVGEPGVSIEINEDDLRRLAEGFGRQPKPSGMIQSIGFQYLDSPMSHGWRSVELTAEDHPPLLTHVADGCLGRVLGIRRRGRYALDFPVRAASALGESIEFVLKPEADSRLYARVRVRSQSGAATRGLWLTFCVEGAEPARCIHDSSDDRYEYLVPVKPSRLAGDWCLLRTNLRDTVRATAGADGYEYAQLESIRLRGDMTIANISIFR